MFFGSNSVSAARRSIARIFHCFFMHESNGYGWVLYEEGFELNFGVIINRVDLDEYVKNVEKKNIYFVFGRFFDGKLQLLLRKENDDSSLNRWVRWETLNSVGWLRQKMISFVRVADGFGSWFSVYLRSRRIATIFYYFEIEYPMPLNVIPDPVLRMAQCDACFSNMYLDLIRDYSSLLKINRPKDYSLYVKWIKKECGINMIKY